MNKQLFGVMLAALLLSSSSLSAFAKPQGDRPFAVHDSGWHRGWFNDNNGNGFPPGYNNWDNGRGANNRPGFDRGNAGWNNGWDNAAANAAAISQFDERMTQMRADVAAQLASGAITPEMANRLNARLDSLAGVRRASRSFTPTELGQLNGRLRHLRSGMRSGALL